MTNEGIPALDFSWLNLGCNTQDTGIATITAAICDNPYFTFHPTKSPTNIPTIQPTMVPTAKTTTEPTMIPTFDPTLEPTIEPTTEPTSTEPTTTRPTIGPSTVASDAPTQTPTLAGNAEETGIETSQRETDSDMFIVALIGSIIGILIIIACCWIGFILIKRKNNSTDTIGKANEASKNTENKEVRAEMVDRRVSAVRMDIVGMNEDQFEVKDDGRETLNEMGGDDKKLEHFIDGHYDEEVMDDKMVTGDTIQKHDYKIFHTHCKCLFLFYHVYHQIHCHYFHHHQML